MLASQSPLSAGRCYRKPEKRQIVMQQLQTFSLSLLGLHFGVYHCPKSSKCGLSICPKLWTHFPVVKCPQTCPTSSFPLMGDF